MTEGPQHRHIRHEDREGCVDPRHLAGDWLLALLRRRRGRRRLPWLGSTNCRPPPPLSCRCGSSSKCGWPLASGTAAWSRRHRGGPCHRRLRSLPAGKTTSRGLCRRDHSSCRHRERGCGRGRRQCRGGGGAALRSCGGAPLRHNALLATPAKLQQAPLALRGRDLALGTEYTSGFCCIVTPHAMRCCASLQRRSHGAGRSHR